MLPSFQILNFRTFRRLCIERLGNVNLIVGKNGVGKTNLLEALRFYAMGSPLALREFLADHEEWAVPALSGEPRLDLHALFHGRAAEPKDIQLGPIGDTSSQLSIRLVDVERVEDSEGAVRYREIDDAESPPEQEVLKAVIAQRRDTRVLFSPEVSRRPQARGKYVGPAYVPARGVREWDLLYWWNTIVLTAAEGRVVEALSLIAPIERIAAADDPTEKTRRTFKARLRGERAPIPLRSLGGGVDRLFEIATALEYSYRSLQDVPPSSLDDRDERPWISRERLLLVDEIENGIHYTAHVGLWKAIFRLARQEHVQVVATSHSWDCLRGFVGAMEEDEQCDGLVIRLENVEGKEDTGAVIIERKDLPIVVRDSIEVR